MSARKQHSWLSETELLAAFAGAVALRWKDEDMIQGEPVGPLVIVYGDGTTLHLGWQTRKVSEDVAARFNLTLDVR